MSQNITVKTDTKMVRSQSATRGHGSDDGQPRRKSIAHIGDRKPSGTTLQVLNERRSSIRFDCFPNPSASPSCRSRSLKSPALSRRHDQFNSSSGTNGGEKKVDSRSLNFSLSVPGDDYEFHRLRNFSITSKGIVNRGDSFRCKSGSTSRSSTPMTPPPPEDGLLQVPEASTKTDTTDGATCVTQTSRTPSTPSTSSDEKNVPRYSVWIMGLAGVGKTSLKLQFMTSEYICQFDNGKEDGSGEKYVTIVVDEDEYELEITECSGSDEKELFERPMPDAFIIVYSVTNRRSYLHSKQLLSQIEPTSGSKAVILVGNKNDLARLRTVSTLEGRSLAKEWGSKFIETSVAINHNVDELLVGIITQIKIRVRDNGKKQNGYLPRSRSNKATGIIKRLWRKTCMPSKSCDNLHSV